MTGPLLRAESLAKRYPSGGGTLTVFENVSFELTQGESVALVGESGAGKSTLLHLMGALDQPTEGRILFGDLSLTEAGERELDIYRNRDVGYVWQSYHLLPEFTALENVLMPLLIAGQDRSEVADEGRRWLEHMGLAERETHQAGELSGGEQQRVAIARSLIRGPKLLLADEPTGNLDQKTGDSIISQVLDLPASDGLTVVIATHNTAFAKRCGRTLRVAGGTIEE